MAPLPASRMPFFLLLSLELVVAALLLAGGPSPAAASMAFLQKKCGEVEKPAVCTRFLGRLPWAIGCSDTRCLALGTLNNICLQLVRRGRVFADRSRSHSPPNYKAAWDACVDAYGKQESALLHSIQLLNNGAVDEASRFLDRENHYPADCEHAFSRTSPMTSWNILLSDAVDLGEEFVLFLLLESLRSGVTSGVAAAPSAAPTGSTY